MSEWNYTSCAKPFDSAQSAINFMKSKDFAGYVLRRDSGYTAVCPSYPEGYYPDAVAVESIENTKGELEAAKNSSTCC